MRKACALSVTTRFKTGRETPTRSVSLLGGQRDHTDTDVDTDLGIDWTWTRLTCSHAYWRPNRCTCQHQPPARPLRGAARHTRPASARTAGALAASRCPARHTIRPANGPHCWDDVRLARVVSMVISAAANSTTRWAWRRRRRHPASCLVSHQFALATGKKTGEDQLSNELIFFYS